MIPVLQPTIDEQTIQDMVAVLRSGWWGFGPKTQEFEKKFADYVGAKYAIATNSGTAALDLCLKAYRIRGGELITTPMTFVADAIVGEMNDMDVTFADIDENSLCLDPSTIRLNADTKAIITVDSHGRLADIDGIREAVRTFNANNGLDIHPLIIEDAAHAMYTPGAGKKGDITIWSFQAVKTLPCGDGGMVTTNDDEVYKRLRTLTWLGVEKSTYERADGKRYTWDYNITQADGIKAYMNDLTAVIGLGQLKRLEEMTAKRRAIQSVYNEHLSKLPQIKIPSFSHTVQYYTMQCKQRDELSEFLASREIATSVHFKPLSEMDYWKKAVKHPIPVNDRVWLELLSIPCHDGLTWEQVDYIIATIQEFYTK
jgi:perosamine synthetase